MEIANPWLYYPALITSPIWCALLAAVTFKAYDLLAQGMRRHVCANPFHKGRDCTRIGVRR